MANEPAKGNQDFEVLKRTPEDLREIMAANIGVNGNITQFDLDRVKVPAGGGLQWSVPTLEGEESVKDVEGIVIYWRDGRVYWKDKFGEGEGGTTPPNCASDDGVTGVGDPGGECAKCPLSQFGSDPVGHRAPACKGIRLLFFVRPGSLMPMVMPVPPTSVQNIKKYFLRLAGMATPYHSVVSRFALEKATNAGGIKYAKITATMARKLTIEEGARVQAFSDSIRSALEKVRVGADDYEVGSEA